MKKIFRNKYVEAQFYWKGVAIGIVYEDGILNIIFPFVAVSIYTYMFSDPVKK